MSARETFDRPHLRRSRRTLLPDAQKGQTSHPPNPGGYFTSPLSLSRQPLRPGTRLGPSKAAASEEVWRYIPHFVGAVHTLN